MVDVDWVDGVDALEQERQRDAGFEPAQRGPPADVDALAERDVRFGSRSGTNRSGSSNRAGSRLAAPSQSTASTRRDCYRPNTAVETAPDRKTT